MSPQFSATKRRKNSRKNSTGVLEGFRDLESFEVVQGDPKDSHDALMRVVDTAAYYPQAVDQLPASAWSSMCRVMQRVQDQGFLVTRFFADPGDLLNIHGERSKKHTSLVEQIALIGSAAIELTKSEKGPRRGANKNGSRDLFLVPQIARAFHRNDWKDADYWADEGGDREAPFLRLVTSCSLRPV